MKILSNKRYDELLFRIERYEIELKALQKNYNHKDNIVKILSKDNNDLKKKICDLKIQLEDKDGFLKQEKQVSNALRKERETYKKPRTRRNTKKESK